ncbi:MAG: hypothetical protein FWC62_02445 [Firmicutes bacterium]|nr:hypothetical protein [Bacillota bacterium]
MDYHDPYFELFRMQLDAIEELERLGNELVRVTTALGYLASRMKVVQAVGEELVIGAGEEKTEERQEGIV